MSPTSIPAVLKALRAFYGAPSAPISTDPFELILWEQVGYLVPDVQRHKAFDALRTQIGLRPAALAAASSSRLTAVARIGGSIAAASRAGRMRQSAELVLDRWKGNLKQVLKLPLPEARRALAAFPMIGGPGADKLLAFTGSARLIPLDSNGLRVLQRLGVAQVHRDYRRSYEAAQMAVAAYASATRAGRIAAFSLLQQHGQTLCRRQAPHCGECPVLRWCPTGQTSIRSS